MTFEECQICSTHGRPQEADTGVLCFNDSNKLRHALTDLELCLAALSPVPGRSGAPSSPIAASKPESKSPANDTALVHLDARSAWSEEDGFGALSVLASWAEIVRDEQGIEQSGRVDVASEVALLRREHNHVVAQDWVVEYSIELASVLAAVQALVGLAPDKPIGPCTVCDGKVFPFEDGARCSSCSRVYRGLAMAEVRTGATLDPMDRVPVSVAVKALEDYGRPTSANTLHQWVNKGHITRGDGGYDMLEILEYLHSRGL